MLRKSIISYLFLPLLCLVARVESFIPAPILRTRLSASVLYHSRSATTSDAVAKGYLNTTQLESTMNYLNSYHSDLLRTMAIAFTELGTTMARKNAFSGGSYKILNATIVNIDPDFITFDAFIMLRSEREPKLERVSFSLDANPVTKKYDTLPKVNLHPKKLNAMDDFVRRFNRLCFIAKQPSVTGKMTRLAFQLGGEATAKLRENMYLNQVPHNRFVRKYFYEMASNALIDAIQDCSDGRISNRMKMTLLFPELNPSMDSYRIGTLLELARGLAIRLAEENLRVRICVQGSMGVGIFTGTPKQLSGVATLLQRMDWQSSEGEENQGMVGNYVNFGAIGKEHVVNDHVDNDGNRVFKDDVFIVLCPQSMVGTETSIIGPLNEMVDAAGDRPVVLINPDLTDKVSSGGQQSVRGRQERLNFASSFNPIFHFQCLYISGTSYFPILGAMSKMLPSEPWVAYQRRDLLDNQGEVYVPVVSSESRPEGETIMGAFES